MQGGFANRFSYYYATPTELIPHPQPGAQQFLDIVKGAVNAIRFKFTQPTGFTWSADTEQALPDWYIKLHTTVKAEQNELVKQALNRTDTQMRKAALLHAAITNETGDYEISVKSLQWAIQLSAYLQAVTPHIYRDFNMSEKRCLEQRVVDLLTQTPKQTARELTKRIRWASAEDINRAVKELVENGTLIGETTTSGRTT